MDLLVIGGTRFVGRHIVETALSHGHRVTLFNRGQSGAELFPDVEQLRGGRKDSAGLTALNGRRWDAVIDTSGYFPADVTASAELLKGSVDRYLFISTVSVFDFVQEGIDENGPLATSDYLHATEITTENYGPLKVLCERAVNDIYGDRATVVRPGLVVGPHDPSGRFTYWPLRIAKGGETLAPGRPQRPVQFVDARDLAEFTMGLLDGDTGGTFNATGPAELLPMRELLETCRAVTQSDATFTWVSDIFLTDRDVKPYNELPLWLPEDEDSIGTGSVDCKKAIGQGLTFRPLSETVKDTRDWALTIEEDSLLDGKLRPEKEHEILRDWHRLSQPY